MKKAAFPSKRESCFLYLPIDNHVSTVYTVNIQMKRRGSDVNLFIDNKSGAPIYDQIYTQIKNEILNGNLQPDEALPSIRALARDLRISVITTKRAYDELEQEGFLYAVPAKGFFVAAKNTELLREENLKKIEAHLTEAVRLAASCGLAKNDLVEMLELLWEE